MNTLCIAIHDVAPVTWNACCRLLAMLNGFGRVPVTLLVVPHFHRQHRIQQNLGFVEDINERIASGDEVALHGFSHRDDVDASGLSGLIRRRVLSAGEGEFAALSADEAARRVDAGLAIFEELGWHAEGFVPPAWLLSRGARAALRSSGLRYFTDHTGITLLRSGRRIVAPAITFSPRSAVRRIASRAWARAARKCFQSTSIVRVGLHPADALHADLMHAWERLLPQLLGDRLPRTKARAIGDSR